MAAQAICRVECLRDGNRYARTVTVIVSEDGEYGASVEVGPEIEA